MRMDGEQESSNVEDVRGMEAAAAAASASAAAASASARVAVALIAGWIFGINPLTMLGLLSGGGGAGRSQQQQGPAPAAAGQRRAGAQFVSQVLHSTEVVWTDVFRQSGQTYQPPKLVLFRGSHADRLRHGPVGDGAVLLPGRPEGLHRPAASTTRSSTSSARPASSRRPT